MPNKTMCTDAIRDVVKSLGRRKYDVMVVRNREVLVFSYRIGATTSRGLQLGL